MKKSLKAVQSGPNRVLLSSLSLPNHSLVPENAFIVCTFWYIHALSALGRIDEARSLFENLLKKRNRLGLLAEHIDPLTGEQWGNFVQTYSMVGLVNSAIRLSKRWDSAF